jgi:anti-anti-sigma regulatory factor
LGVSPVLLHAVVTIIDWDLSALAHVDAGTVDALARLQLTARRSGACVRLCNATAELRELVDFMGLSDVLLCVEARGQAEQRKHRVGVEEERELDDPSL